MKVRSPVIVGIVIVGLLLFTAIWTASAETTRNNAPRQSCIDHLKWNRWKYTEAHVNVTQAKHERQPTKPHWVRPSTQRACRDAKWRAKMLRRGEEAHWANLRLSKTGVKWIIRRRFRSGGRQVVLNAWQVVSCESGFYYRAWNGSDAGPWQIHLSAHHDVSWAEAMSPEQSTEWAWRASDHGRNFAPTWVCASLRGIA